MKKFVLAVAAMACVVGAQAQQRSFTAQGVLQPLSGQLGDSVLLEVLGKGPGGDYSEYYSLDGLPGSTPAAMADHTVALAAQALSPFTQASARFSYDLSATNISSTPGAGLYEGTGFSLSLGGTGGVVDTLSATDTRVVVRDRTTRRVFSVSASGDGYPPAPLSPGGALLITDPTPPTYSVDLQPLMASAGCCSSLHLSAPGSLWVRLQAPTEYRPVYMGLGLLGSRSTTDPVDGSLPSTLDLARYDQDQQLYVVFGGHYSLTVDEAAYASPTDYLAAKAWIEGNISLVNAEFTADYALTGLQAVPVPEPATAGLLAAGMLMLVFRHRRHRCAV
jgi:hypothetical protein